MKILKKLFNPTGAGAGAFILAFASTLSYLFGMARDLVLAHFFGASIYTDAFNASFLIPDFIFNLLIAGATTGVLMPVFLSTEKESKKDGEELFSTFLTVMNGLVVLLAIVAFFVAPFLIERFFSEVSAEQQKMVVNLTRIMLFSPIFFGFSNSFGSILVARKRFFSFAVSPILYNGGILLGIYCFAGYLGIYSAALGAVIGAFLHVLIRLIDFILLDQPVRFSLNVHTKNFPKIITLAIPKTIGMLAYQGMLWGFAYLAYALGEGSFAAFSYARNVQSFSVSIFGIAMATAVFPFLAEFAAEKDHDRFVSRTEKSARQILFLAVPATCGLFVLANLVVRVIFAHGEFDSNDVFLTTSVLAMISLSIPFESLGHLFGRSFLAHKNTMIPMWGQIIFFVAAVGGAALFYQDFGVQSFGISFTVATVLQIAFLMLMFQIKIHSFPFKSFFKSIFMILLISFLMVVVVVGVLNFSHIANKFVLLTAAVLAGIFVYFGLAFLLKMPELERVSWYFKNKFKKSR